MASTLKKTIDIIFNGVDDVSGVIDTISGKMENVGNNVGDLAAPFEKGTEAILAMDAAIALVAIAGLAMSDNIDSAAKKMVASLEKPSQEAEKFAEVAKEVYSSGITSGLEKAFDAVTLAQQKFKDETSEGIKEITESAFELEKVFSVDYEKSLASVSTLMTNFGLSSEEAFDFIASGYQKGLDGSGDFLESINEYATQFSNGGANAGQFFSVLESGFQEGLLGTDKAADAFKEFRIRILDGSDTVAEALDQIGLGEQFTQSLASGKITAVDAFNTVIEKLGATEDEAVVMQAGVGLLGTTFEDLGTKAALSLDTTITTMGDLKGAMDTVEDASKTLSTAALSAFRTLSTEFADLDIWDKLGSELSEKFEFLSKNLPEAFENLDLSGIEGKATEIYNIFMNALGEQNLDFTTVEGLNNALQTVVETVESVLEISQGVAEVFVPLADIAVDLVQGFNSLDDSSKNLIGNVLAVGTAVGGVATAITGLGVAGSSISSLISLVGGSSGGTGTLTGAFSSLVSNPGIKVLSAGAAGWTIGTAIRELVPSVDEAAQEMWRLVDSVIDFSGQKGNVQVYENLEATTTEAKKAAESIDKVSEAVENVPNSITISPEVDAQDAAEIAEELEKLTEGKEVVINTDEAKVKVGELANDAEELRQALEDKGILIEADTSEVEEATTKVNDLIVVGQQADGTDITMEVSADTTSAENALDDVSKKVEEVPSEKLMSISLQGDIDTELAKIKASAETVQTSMEWTAQVDIAQVEAATARIEAAYGSINTTIQSTGEVISAAFGAIDSSSYQGRVAALDAIRQESEYREQALEMQKQLNDAQIAYLDARTEALNSGDMGITITSDGLEPALEMIMWEIIKKVQVKANEESADFLLGIS